MGLKHKVAIKKIMDVGLQRRVEWDVFCRVHNAVIPIPNHTQGIVISALIEKMEQDWPGI